MLIKGQKSTENGQSIHSVRFCVILSKVIKMKRIAKTIVKVLLQRGVITYDDIELYEYGIILLITTTIGAISMLAIAGLLFGFGIGV